MCGSRERARICCGLGARALDRDAERERHSQARTQREAEHRDPDHRTGPAVPVFHRVTMGATTVCAALADPRAALEEARRQAEGFAAEADQAGSGSGKPFDPDAEKGQ